MMAGVLGGIRASVCLIEASQHHSGYRAQSGQRWIASGANVLHLPEKYDRLELILGNPAIRRPDRTSNLTDFEVAEHEEARRIWASFRT
jgi:hypothetical protein